MKATITHIDVERIGSNQERFLLVRMKQTSTGEPLKTYLCSSYDNFAHWKDALHPGTIVDNLTLKTNGLVDADCRPRIVSKPAIQQNLL
jgi:hypothetical protein